MRTCALLGLLLLQPAFGEYADVHGLKMYYEIHGKGRPVVLLHGGMHGIETSFAKQIPVLAQSHRVIAVEQMGHGHTRDVPGRPLTYEAMAEDTAALLVQLGIRDADLIGWSDGGQIALRLAFTHPELVRRVIASGVGFGAPPGMFKQAVPDKVVGRNIAGMFPAGYEAYKRISPDGPDHWTAVAVKGRAMWSAPTWGFTPADLAKIRRPVLIVSGDRDIVPLEENTRMVRAIPKAELLILPGTGHTTFQDRPALLNPILVDFLDRN
jgi:pimeloyl-ACP methyl ester carboxylesterase